MSPFLRNDLAKFGNYARLGQSVCAGKLRFRRGSSLTIQSMYSPKISEELIPRIYRAAKEEKIPMTRWVNEAVARALPGSPQEKTDNVESIESASSDQAVAAE